MNTWKLETIGSNLSYKKDSLLIRRVDGRSSSRQRSEKFVFACADGTKWTTLKVAKAHAEKIGA